MNDDIAHGEDREAKVLDAGLAQEEYGANEVDDGDINCRGHEGVRCCVALGSIWFQLSTPLLVDMILCIVPSSQLVH